jgi:hypothetical protein
MSFGVSSGMFMIVSMFGIHRGKLAAEILAVRMVVLLETVFELSTCSAVFSILHDGHFCLLLLEFRRLVFLVFV